MADLSNPKARLKQLNIVYWAMGSTQVLVGVAAYVLITFREIKPDYSLAVVFQKVALFAIPGLLAAGYFLFKYQLRQIDPKAKLAEKVKQYFSFVLIRSALFEVAFFICCVSALVTGVELFLYMALVPFMLFLLMRPNPSDLQNDLQLSDFDLSQIVDP